MSTTNSSSSATSTRVDDSVRAESGHTDTEPSEGRHSGSRFGGLDGLRAIAVVLVIVYHYFPTALPGGFLGVDIFFVISGFLITSLLLRQWARTGRIDLLSFWRRRARRLLPALGLVLLICTSLALAFGNRDLLVNIKAQLLGALAFVSNWVFVALGSDYFTRDNPELFRNTWSLSIEEQFYVVLPLLMLLILRSRSRVTRSLLFLLLAIASATMMAVFAANGATESRVYFGSDTHVFGLFAGVSLAVLLQRTGMSRSKVASAQRPSTTRQLSLLAFTVAGLTVLGWLAATLEEGSPESFAWGFQVASLAALLVIWAISRPGAWVGQLLDIAPMRWVGERSYGIYLWHWPLLLIFPTGPIIGLTLSVVCAAISFHFVEQPVRRLGLRRSLRLLVQFRHQARLPRVVAIALASVFVITIPATATAVAIAPERSSSAEAIARGEAAMKIQQLNDINNAIAQHGFVGVFDLFDSQVRKPSGAPATTEAAPEAPSGKQIFAVGDSVMLASLPELQEQFAGIRVDAVVSRGLSGGIGVVKQIASKNQLRPVLVLGLGTNGPIERLELSRLKRIVGDSSIVLVNAHADRTWIPGVNETLASFANTRRGVVLADWNAAIGAHPEELAGDGIHPNTGGGVIYAETIQAALEELQTPAERIN